MAQKKPTSFSTILLVILIVSTVIVFAVLLFLSYENIINSTFEQKRTEVYNNCQALATASEVIIDGESPFYFHEEDYKSQVIMGVIDTRVNTDGGSAYVIDNKYVLKYSKNPLDDFKINTSEAQVYGYSEQQINIDESTTILAAIKQVSNSDVYIVYADVYDRQSAVQEFNSIILFPAMIAVLIAIVLLQSNKASDAGQIITGGNSLLMGQMKERGPEKVVSNITLVLGIIFFVLVIIIRIIEG